MGRGRKVPSAPAAIARAAPEPEASSTAPVSRPAFEGDAGLPAPLTRFVGRREALADLARSFARSQRLVTVWGPAGMGKTRLAIEHARGRRAAGEVVLHVPLAEVSDPGAACAAVARACGAHPGNESGAELVKLVGRALAARGPVLLVLDNLEQLLPEIARAIGAWLETAPSARVLATSRERTRLPGEVAMELSPLTLPEDAAPADAAPSEAAELFLARVNEQRPDEPGGALHAARVAELVRSLEGIPLAIELAAARFDVLGLDGLLARLGRRLDLLGRPRRAGDPRTSTLRGAIEWSWSLLPDDERVALARCSVFAASFSLDAASSVLDGLPAPAVDLLQALRDKSMLRLSPAQDGASAPRFTLYEAVRELAAEKLAQMPGEAALAARLFTEHHLAEGEALAARFAKTGDVAAIAAIAREAPHLSAIAARASVRSADAGAPPPDSRAPGSIDALRALVAMDPAVTARGGAAAHASMLDQALAAAERSGAPPLLFARGLGARGRARMLCGGAEDAERDLERALSLAVVSGDRALEAELLADLGVLAHRRADLPRALGLYERALAVDRAAGGTRTEGRVLGNLGAAHHDAHRHEQAIEHYERALSILAMTGDRRMLGIVSTNLGTLEQEQGATSAARRRFERAAALLGEAGDLRLLGITLTSLGLLHHEEGRLEEARFCHEQALQKLSVAGDQRSLGLAFVRLGALLGSQGQLDEARVAFARGARAAGEGDALVQAATELAHGLLDLTAARRAQDERRPDAAAAHLARAVARAEQAREGGPGQPSAAERSDDVRTLLRILGRGVSALSGSAVEEGGRAGGEAAPERALLLAPQGRWMRCPGGAWQDLRRRGPARRLLIELALRQREAPGAGVSLDELREAAWPGERMAPASAANRIYVALHQLRGLGLQDRVIRTQDGYLLDPTLPVYHVAIEPVEEAG